VDGDIELEITPGSRRGNYSVRVVHAPSGGETSSRIRLDVDAILARISDLEATVLASAVSARRTIPISEQPLHDVGEKMFNALFTGAVKGTYRASLGAAQNSGHPLRVVLRLGAPELVALPWEMLYDRETESYLCHELPLLRRVPAADYSYRPLAVEPPLRILGVVPAVRDLPALDTEAEKENLTTALAEPISAGLIELRWVPNATWDGIQSALLDGPWHVVHFIGHGDYDVVRQEGLLALESATGRSSMVESSRLLQLLREAEPTPRLVVLNSCSSGESGKDDLFSGTAAALVRGGISAVAAMQFTVTDSAAIAFSRGFYGALAHGRDIDRAANSGRRSIMGLGTFEWVTPVLYVRGDATRLFNLTGVTSGAGLIPPAPTSSPIDHGTEEPRKLALYERALSSLREKQYPTAISLLGDLLTLDTEFRDAAALLAGARQSQEFVDIYYAARQAQNVGDWAVAARGYERIQDDPDFQDAGPRRESCERRQRLADLRKLMWQHAEMGDWRSVLALHRDLVALDSSATDPSGLVSRAHKEIIYAMARKAERSGRLTEAVGGYKEVVRLDPGFRDAMFRLRRYRPFGE
jgi:hypothetical protein